MIIFNHSTDIPHFKNEDRARIIDLNDESDGLAGILKKIFEKLQNYFRDLLLYSHNFTLLNYYDKHFRMQNLKKKIYEQNVDLVIFTSPYNLASQLDIPTMVPIHDLEHRYSQFPEVAKGKRYLYREYLISMIAKYAYRIFSESEAGKNNIVRIYNIRPERIEVIKLLPPNYLAENLSDKDAILALERLGLPKKYLFYPAQLWPHKNHIAILRAMQILKE